MGFVCLFPGSVLLVLFGFCLVGCFGEDGVYYYYCYLFIIIINVFVGFVVCFVLFFISLPSQKIQGRYLFFIEPHFSAPISIALKISYVSKGTPGEKCILLPQRSIVTMAARLFP